MAKKKDKPQVINNIQELNLEIDYSKLAKAIIEAQEQASKIETYDDDKDEYISKTLSGKVKKNYFSFSLAKLVEWIFYVIGIGEVFLTVHILPKVKDYVYVIFADENMPIWFAHIMCVFSVVIVLAISLLSFCIFFNIAREIKKEKDRNFVIAVFSGIVSFAALIVALVALFKEVG